MCDDGKEGSGKCVCLDQSNDPEIFCQGVIDQDRHHNEQEEVTFGFILLMGVVFFMTFVVYFYHQHPKIQIIPESVLAIVIGILLGLFFKFYYKDNGQMLNILQFEPHSFFLFLLPPIMYEAGFGLRIKPFLKNIFAVLAVTILATLFASFIFSLCFYFGSQYTDFGFSLIQSLQFGCFISAIDPVATISIFKKLSVTDVLFTLVMGECVLNDAVAIALSESVKGFAESGGGEVQIGWEIGKATWSFFSLFTVSLLIGFVFGLLFSYIFSKFDMYQVPWIEMGIFVLASYFPYIFAEGFEYSGLLAILMMSIIMRNYCYMSLSPVSSISIEYLIETLSQMSENFVFCYLGITIPIMLDDVKPSLIIVGIVALLASRFLSVYMTFSIINIFKKKKMPFSYTVVMTWGGLRGAIAFYLALKINSEYKNLIITTTMCLIVFTIVVLGSTMTPVIKLMLWLFP